MVPIPAAAISLGITEAMWSDCRLPYYQEAVELISAGKDIFGREQRMTPQTLSAWSTMSQSALAEGVRLQLVSAFRSVEYQCTLISGKLERGIALDEILRVNAIPGRSEHHSGRALDLTTPGVEPLSLEFAESDAFAWLDQRAEQYGFGLSFPRDNPWGIEYEPWHWALEA